jgi:hypothetical protein
VANKQISFSDPIGSTFHAFVMSEVERRKSNGSATSYHALAAECLLEGIRLVKSRGVIADVSRKALKLESDIKSEDPNRNSTPIYYEDQSAVEAAVNDCMTATTLNGPRKVLKEAMVEFLQSKKP